MYIMEYQPRWLAAGDKGTMIVKNFDGDGHTYRTGALLEKLPPQITETVAGPTRQFAPVPPGGIVAEALPEITSDWVDFYRNVDTVLAGWDDSPKKAREKSLIRIPEVKRVLTVMEAVRKSAETGQAVAPE